jgi:hypothetical protein
MVVLKGRQGVTGVSDRRRQSVPTVRRGQQLFKPGPDPRFAPLCCIYSRRPLFRGQLFPTAFSHLFSASCSDGQGVAAPGAGGAPLVASRCVILG